MRNVPEPTQGKQQQDTAQSKKKAWAPALLVADNQEMSFTTFRMQFCRI